MFARWRYASLCRRRAAVHHAAATSAWKQLHLPLPSGTTRWNEAAWIAVDFETTGLDAEREQILSMGWVPLDGDVIRIDRAVHVPVHGTRPLEESNVLVHRISDDQRRQGVALDAALEALAEAARGRLFLMHFAELELGFLRVLARRRGWPAPALAFADTLQHAVRRARHDNRPLVGRHLSLAALRRQHGLPMHTGHHAQSDAIATAELFLAQRGEADTGTPATVRQCLRYGAAGG